jgi:hypothetical protein
MKSMQRSPKRQRISFDGRLYPHATSARAELTDSCRVLEFPQVVTPEAQHRNDQSLMTGRCRTDLFDIPRL